MRAFSLALLPALIAAAPAPPFDPAMNARVLDAAVAHVADRYWDKARLGPAWAAAVARHRPAVLAATGEAARYAALNALLDTLNDSHVYAVAPTRVALDRARDAGEAAAGFGFSFWREGDAWRILSVRPDGPAARAGVQIGWALVSVDGAPAGTDFRPAIDRDSRLVFADETGRRRTVTLRGAILPAEPEMRARVLDGGALLLAIDDFTMDAARWLRERLEEGPPPPAVILDLRENGGGDADAIARIAGRFFLERHTLLRRTYRDGFEDVPIAGAGSRAYAGPLAVLVGPRSASGAEAIAALVEETGRGVTVGERTSGALTGAAEETLPDGGLLSIAVFDIRTGQGKRIEGTGFTPGHIVRPTLADQRAGRDPVLAAAEALVGG